MGKLLTIKQLAELLQVAEVTIYGWKKNKNIPYLQVGNTIRFDEEQVLEWMKSKK